MIEFDTSCERYNKEIKSLHQIDNDFQKLADSPYASSLEEALTTKFFKKIPQGILYLAFVIKGIVYLLLWLATILR